MAREEQIIKQADIYTDNGGLSVTNDIELVRKAFIEGAKWADNNIHLSSLWNDTNILPSDNKDIVYLTKNGKIGVIKAIKSNNWDWYNSCSEISCESSWRCSVSCNRVNCCTNKKRYQQRTVPFLSL